VRYTPLHSDGVQVNPMIVSGQTRGGIERSTGNAPFEYMGYDENGQPTATSFSNYLTPDATETPTIDCFYRSTPSPLNPQGVKAGEADVTPSAAAVIYAIKNALERFGARIIQVPLTPHRLGELIATGRGKGT
jgi:aerobic carbon-monoxide dehydrogenase large subunit